MLGFFVIKVSPTGVYALGQEDFTPAQQAALAHILANAGRDPVTPVAKGEALPRREMSQDVRDNMKPYLLTGADMTSERITAQQGKPPAYGGSGSPPGHTVDIVTRSPVAKATIAKAQGYTGDACTQCHSFTVKQTGKCTVCENCGATSGCS